MNNGIVLKVNRSSVVVLTANGEYLKCKKLLSSYSIGEEIQFPNNAIILNKKMKLSIPKLIPVVIVSGLILFSFTFINLNREEALAAGKVTIDSGAKVSLILDKQLNVIDLKAHNEQGKKVINKMDNWKQEPLHLVMDDLVGEMEKSKVIEPNEKIKLTGEMNKEFENKQSVLNHELKDIQESDNHFNIPNSKELDQPKIKIQNHKQNQSQNQNKQEKSFNSNSTKVIKGENNYKDKSIIKSPTIIKDKENDNGHPKEVQNNRHQEEHWGNKQRQWNHRNQDEHHESSKQNQKKQYNNNEKHQDKKKNDYNDNRKLRRSDNDQGRNEHNEGCHGCNNRYKNNENENENENDNGWHNGSEKRSD
ncbi:anti-sigma factor domain-containing protein [Gottfriedia sp. S16(2024)]|uniref:anti-sigma factor domain-containing protein n=1 Tax=Gottfriedia sp. S16(2024) TaxID=3162883 RepID=UPI003D198E2A